MYTEPNKVEDGKLLEFSKVVWFNFGIGEELVDGDTIEREHPYTVQVWYTYNPSETPRKVSYKKSCVNIPLGHIPPELYQTYLFQSRLLRLLI